MDSQLLNNTVAAQQKGLRNRRELQALDVLERFPCTSRAIARLTKMPHKSASSVLCKLYQLGALTRTRIDPYGRSRPPYLYSIKRAA